MSAEVLQGLGAVAGAVQAPMMALGDATSNDLPGIADPRSMATTVEFMPIAVQALGSGIAGAIIGGLAASDWRGAGTGALATAGLTTLRNGAALLMLPSGSQSYLQQRPMAIGLTIAGLAAGGMAIWLAVKRRR